MEILGETEGFKASKLNKAGFERRYKQSIRPGFDWELLSKSGNKYSLLSIDNDEELGNLYTCWNKKGSARYSPQKLQVKQLTKDYLKKCNLKLDAEFIVFRIPAVKVGKDKIILPDGNHRASYLYHFYDGQFVLLLDLIEPAKPILFDSLFI